MPIFCTAEDLGFGFKGVQLSLDGCVTPDPRHKGYVDGFSFGTHVAAHTHLCKREPYFGYICIPKKLVKTIYKKPSNLFLHEYGHFLDSASYQTSCEEHISVVRNSFEAKEFQKTYTEKVHGTSWKNIMQALGKPELANTDPIYINDLEYLENPF